MIRTFLLLAIFNGVFLFSSLGWCETSPVDTATQMSDTESKSTPSRSGVGLMLCMLSGITLLLLSRSRLIETTSDTK